MNRLVLFVEGEGDRDAVPGLVGQLLTHHSADDCVYVDGDPIKAQNFGKLLKRDPGKEVINWVRWLGAASKRENAAAVLLLLDGDADRVKDPAYVKRFSTDQFCPYHAAAHLASIAHQQGATRALSVGVAFAVKEIESWAMTVIDQMAGKDLGGGVRIPANLTPPDDPRSVRSAKEWLRQYVEYKPSQHQKALLRNFPLEIALERSRSFRHLDNAIGQIAHACRTGAPVCCPPLP